MNKERNDYYSGSVNTTNNKKDWTSNKKRHGLSTNYVYNMLKHHLPATCYILVGVGNLLSSWKKLSQEYDDSLFSKWVSDASFR